MRLLKTLGRIAMLSTMSAAISVHAYPITDVVDPADTTITLGSTPSPCPANFTCLPGSVSFVHDITADGFVAGVNTVTSGTLAIHLTDSRGGGHETYEVDVGSSQTFAANVPSGGGGRIDIFDLDSSAIADLNADGKLTVVVRSVGGSFGFADSLLTVNDPPQPLPEPASLALFAIACALGFGARRRRWPKTQFPKG